MKYTPLLLGACLGFSACFEPPKDETISGYVSPHAVWVLQTLNGDAVDATVTIAFPEEGRVFGNAPCNSYSATQKAPLPWFELGPILSTKKACPELALEVRYFDVLAQTNSAEVLSDTLILEGPAGALVYLRQEVAKEIE